MSVLMWRSSLSKSKLNSPGLRALGLCVFLLWLPNSLKADEQHNSFELATTCTAGFKLIKGGRCELNSPYDSHRSPNDSGVGRPRAGVPDIRDGFAPQVINLDHYFFFDPLLSARNSIACSNCPDPDYGFADGRGRVRGISKTMLDRYAYSL